MTISVIKTAINMGDGNEGNDQEGRNTLKQTQLRGGTSLFYSGTYLCSSLKIDFL